MSQPEFQANLARLVVDLHYLEEVRMTRGSALKGDLTEAERKRLLFIAGDKGLQATRMLYEGFRLNKVLRTVPLTVTLLGRQRLARQTNDYWKTHPSTGLHYIDEGLAFCEFLRGQIRRGLRVTYLSEVVAYEQASLELKRIHLAEGEAAEFTIEYSHDPETLLGSLADGRRPRAVPAMHCVLRGTLDEEGNPVWDVSPML